MSTSSFDPSRVIGFGSAGQETARKMSYAAQSHSLAITYDSESKKFTVLESSNLSKEKVEKIFNESKYEGWYPKVLDSIDALGNRVAVLQPSPGGVFVEMAIPPSRERAKRSAFTMMWWVSDA
ncbi:MAG: hypothetical protein V4489_01195 [Chlamydiota bacterium]